MKLDPGLKQYDLGLAFSLSISQLSIFHRASFLDKLSPSVPNTDASCYLPQGSNPGPNFLADLERITVTRGVGYTRWPRPRSHVSHHSMGVETSLFSSSPESREDQSPQNKIKSVVSRSDVLHKHAGTRRTNKFTEYYPSLKKEFWISSRIQVLPAEEKKRRMYNWHFLMFT